MEETKKKRIVSHIGLGCWPGGPIDVYLMTGATPIMIVNRPDGTLEIHGNYPESIEGLIYGDTDAANQETPINPDSPL